MFSSIAFVDVSLVHFTYIYEFDLLLFVWSKGNGVSRTEQLYVCNVECKPAWRKECLPRIKIYTGTLLVISSAPQDDLPFSMPSKVPMTQNLS